MSNKSPYLTTNYDKDLLPETLSSRKFKRIKKSPSTKKRNVNKKCDGCNLLLKTLHCIKGEYLCWKCARKKYSILPMKGNHGSGWNNVWNKKWIAEHKTFYNKGKAEGRAEAIEEVLKIINNELNEWKSAYEDEGDRLQLAMTEYMKKVKVELEKLKELKE